MMSQEFFTKLVFCINGINVVTKKLKLQNNCPVEVLLCEKHL